jgi:hypothetical protein
MKHIYGSSTVSLGDHRATKCLGDAYFDIVHVRVKLSPCLMGHIFNWAFTQRRGVYNFKYISFAVQKHLSRIQEPFSRV